MSVAKTDLKFYLTTSEAGTVQPDSAQSIGGYVSSTPFNSPTTLSSSLSQSSPTIALASSMSENNLLVDHEFIAVSGSNIAVRGNLSTLSLPHALGSTVFGITPNSLFNDSFSESGAQYRCIAVRNENATSSFYNLNFYLRNTSLDAKCPVSLGVEYAQKEVISSETTGGGSITLVDTSLIGLYADNYFANCPLIFTSGVNVNLTRVIASFDSSTGTIVFTQSLTVPVAANMEYRIEQLPSQRLNAGNSVSPSSDEFSGFVSGNIPINTDGNRINGNTLEPFETVYLWLKRQTTQNAEQYLSNRVVFTAHYTTS